MAKRQAKRRSVKPPPLPSYNLSHDDVKHKIEFVFAVKGKKYYRFIDDHQIPVGRYKYVYAALKEVDLRMSLDTLKSFVLEMKKILDGGMKKNMVSMEMLWKMVMNLETRISVPFEPGTVKRLASILFFDETEDLRTYTRKHGDDKIRYWEDNNVIDFFLTMPIVELLGLRNISPEYLEVYIKEQEEILKALTLDPQIQSSGNSSENGKSPSSSSPTEILY